MKAKEILARRVWPWALTAATVLLALWAVAEALALYASGYTRELAAAALGRLRWPAALWLALALAGWRFRPEPARPAPVRPKPSPAAGKGRVWRGALYLLALALLILGVGNQGMRDVLVKAIQICTECIGLG